VKLMLSDVKFRRPLADLMALNCGFIGWVDPPMYERAMDVIPWPLRARNMLEEDLEVHVLKLRKKE
ncbi:hypothetical protein Tco_1270641, partial [Tanacetum coccineum]